jgi:uncharacterized membrane protein YadS
MSDDTAANTLSVEPVRNSAKREIAATVITVVVVGAIGVVTSGLLDRLGKRIHDQIAPPAKTEN